MAAALAMGSAIASTLPASTVSRPLAQQAQAKQLSDLEQAAEQEQEQAALSAELFYEILVGEMAAQAGALGDAQALMMEAARSSNDEKLYRRATELALQSRSGDRALRNARAWLEAYPESRDANRAMLRILVAMNRIADSASHLRREVELTPEANRSAIFLGITQLYNNASDKPLAADIVEQALQGNFQDPKNGPMAWATVGHMRLIAGQKPAALLALQNGAKLSPESGAIALLAMELLESGSAEVEPLVQRYLEKNHSPQLRITYARVLLGQNRNADAKAQLQRTTREAPEFPEAWAMLANLQLQDNELDAAEVSLTQFNALLPKLPDGVGRNAGESQFYLLKAELAEKRQHYEEADSYLQRIPDSANLLSVQARRADLLVRQGKIPEARALIQAIPANGPNQKRLKQVAEVQLLRAAGLHQEAYALQARLLSQYPGDVELSYDTALLAERVGKFDEMERLLRDIIERKPDFQHAYNALGYSYADRNIKLEEAKTLVQKALDMAPGDPFITDSLAWVHFRLGNLSEAEKLLEQAYATRQDVEIAAHLGEVLWAQGKQERALLIWRQALQTDSRNSTLQETLQRLKVKP